MGTVSLPAFADTATVQTGTQGATITGDNNQVIQVINQVNVNHPGMGRGRAAQNTATVQDAYQGAAVQGSGNAVYQESTQININQANPGRRVGQGGAHPGNGNRGNQRK